MDSHLPHPNRLLKTYDKEIQEQLGVAPGGAWTYRDWNRKIGWGHMKGLARCHALYGDILQALKEGRQGAAIVTCVQAMKCVHQVCLDGGDWRTGVLYMPVSDPLARKEFGGFEEEAEVISAYRKSLAELKKAEANLRSSLDGAGGDTVGRGSAGGGEAAPAAKNYQGEKGRRRQRRWGSRGERCVSEDLRGAGRGARAEREFACRCVG